MNSLPKNVYRERIDFSKIKTTVPIPNLIEIQRKSYERFLQMNRLPSEREDQGLQSVFKSVFPISDFRENSSLEFIEYSIGNWECKCGKLAGLHHLRKPCSSCGATLVADPYGDREVLCPRCGTGNHARGDVCDICGQTVALKLKYDVDECQERGMTYAVPLKVTIRLVVWNKDPETGVKTIRDIKEQEVYFGDIPLMTENGTFIINGTERVIVSQLHRSPGAFFHEDRAEKEFVGQIIPYRGSWVEFKYDAKNLLYVSVDRKRKFLASVFLRALGLRGADEIIRQFYTVHRLFLGGNTVQWAVSDAIVGLRSRREVKIPGTETTIGEGKKITVAAVAALRKAGVDRIDIIDEARAGAFAAADLVDPSTGEVLLEANDELTERVISMAQEKAIEYVDVFFPEADEVGPVVSATLKKDAIKTHEEALVEIYRRLRPGDPPTLDSSRSLFENMFFNPQKYDFSRVGRLKLNTKLGMNTPLDEKILHPQDFFEVIKYQLRLRKSPQNVDDIDPLGNRRVRSVGELLENQFRIGLVRMERAIKEKMSVYQEMATAMPHDLINAKPVMAAIREFFGSSQLSQFMDQTNPLSEITHKRRLSALGPGGLSRERAGFEVRDVHPTHYGRICPIETPEGPNIGLISSLSCYARINEFGFIESPYRKVKDGRVTDYVIVTNAGGHAKYKAGDIVEAEDLVSEDGRPRKKGVEVEPFSFYLSAWEEDQYVIAQANAKVDGEGRLSDERVNSRQAGNFILAPRDTVQFIDVSPKQLVSVAASLIPFLENDDANRALMGSNMQRQAVPLLKAEAPFVGTGMEETVARDSGAAIAASRGGVVDQVDATRIDILADGPSTELGELALGRNSLVAFMPWNGYNYEDSILISERIVKDDVFTSIHIEEFEVMARDTKLGPEDITRDIPNVGEEALRNLDEAGIVYIGAEVEPGDILCGKITPKGESPMTPEEKLLRAIFGEKASDVRDTSLRLPPGVAGAVVEVRVFNRHGIDIDDRTRAIQTEEKERLKKDADDEKAILNRATFSRLREMLVGQVATAAPKGLKKGSNLDEETLESVDRYDWWKIAVKDDKRQAHIEALKAQYDEAINVIVKRFEDRVEKLERGDELPPGVLKMVKVFVAVKRKLQPGDKMAGRHGNKGVISRILPNEDMPFLEDGTPVDIVLNPLGVPSRMNVGQIFETHLGWAARGLGQQIQEMLDGIHERGKDIAGKDVKAIRTKLKDIYGAHYAKDIDGRDDDAVMDLASNLVGGIPMGTPVFDGAREADVSDMLDMAGLDRSGQVVLFDGRTGVAFDRKVTVGYIYMLKLHHLVDDKIHARSIGPYSLVTQQPLGGKAQFGGQRFGEMEVWALQAYGAAYTLQEMLTVKSDDVIGRTKVYEAIVKGDDTFEAGIPESFNVLVKEMRSLGLNVELDSVASEDDPPALAAE